MDKTIYFDYQKDLSLDFVVGVAKEKFPNCQIERHSRFVRIRKNMFVCANVFIDSKVKNNIPMSRIGINGGMDSCAGVLLGFIWHFILRGDFLAQVKTELQDALTKQFNIQNFY